MARLCEITPLPIALDEELIGICGFEEKKSLIENIKPQYIILKPSLHGGIKGSDEWIRLAEAQSTRWWITSALESNVGLNAIAQYTFEKDVQLPQGLGTGGLYTNNFDSPLYLQGQIIRFDPSKKMGPNCNHMISETPEWKKFKSLSIDGRKRSLHEWRAHAQQQLQEGYGIGELEDILEFVVDWSNTKDWIQARTSGSTGRPKNLKIKKEHILASAKRTLDFLALKPGDSALLCMPNRFIGGKMMIARSIIGDLDLHIADTTATPELPNGKSIDFAAVVPMQLYNITEDPAASEQWKKVKKIIVGGGQVDPRLDERGEQLAK